MNPELVHVLENIMDPKDTTCGGGCASAFSGAMAAGMIAMVADVSKKKPVNFTVEQYDAIIAECNELLEKLQEGCVADTKAFGGILAAFKLPKETDEDKAARRKAIDLASIHAAEVPLSNARMCQRVHEIGVSLKGNSNPGCNSDLMSALYLSAGAVKDLALNIEANLGSIKNEPEKSEELKEAMRELLLDSTNY